MSFALFHIALTTFSPRLLVLHPICKFPKTKNPGRDFLFGELRKKTLDEQSSSPRFFFLVRLVIHLNSAVFLTLIYFTLSSKLRGYFVDSISAFTSSNTASAF